MSGTLLYIMGPSGSGKDSLIDAARPLLAERNVVVARRIITRSAESVGEQAVGVTPEQFRHRAARGEFALHWQANGLDYGIGLHIEEVLAGGGHVLVNGSRAYLGEAAKHFADLIPVLLTVRPDVLRQRLLGRGRENIEQIEQRLARSEQLQEKALQSPPGVPAVEPLDNSDDLTLAVKRLESILLRHGISVAADRT